MADEKASSTPHPASNGSSGGRKRAGRAPGGSTQRGDDSSPQPGGPASAQPGGSGSDPAAEATAQDSGPSKGTYIALILSILLVIGVLVGSKVAYHNATHKPVTLASINAPGAKSAECKDLVDELPDHFGGYDRVDLADPAPDGAAVWVKDDDRIVLRCGLVAPLQYTELTSVEDNSGKWMAIQDPSGENFMTWYSIGRTQEVAISGPSEHDYDFSELSDALAKNPESDSSATAKPAPAPLSELATAGSSLPTECQDLINALPDTLSDRKKTTKTADGKDLPAGMVAWTADHRDPFVLRCGVKQAPDYKPGVSLQEVNGVPWFNSSGNPATSESSEAPSADSGEAVSGTEIASIWYTQGFSSNVALSMPAGTGNEAITTLSEVIPKHLKKTGN